MITRLRHRLARILLWLVDRLVPPVVEPPNPLLARVKALVQDADRLDASGAYKKWQVVAAALRKEFPLEKARDLNFLIELAVRQIRATRG